jgi:hypothetical protein
MGVPTCSVVGFAEAIDRAFVDRETDRKAFFIVIIFGFRPGHADIRKTLAEIEAAQQFAVGLDLVGIVDIVAQHETEDIALAGLDHGLELPLAEGPVSGKIDRLDGGLGPFGDLEHQVQPVGAVADGQRYHPDVVASRSAVDVSDPSDV